MTNSQTQNKHKNILFACYNGAITTQQIRKRSIVENKRAKNYRRTETEFKKEFHKTKQNPCFFNTHINATTNNNDNNKTDTKNKKQLKRKGKLFTGGLLHCLNSEYLSTQYSVNMATAVTIRPVGTMAE